MKKWFVYLVVGVFLLSAGTVSAIVSDDFKTPSLNPVWTFVNPVSDATLTMTGTNVEIAVPSGTAHDVWSSGNFAPRIMQSAADADFEIEVKFQSELSVQYQMQGIIVEQDSSNFLRFDFFSTSSEVKIYAAAIQSGGVSVKNDATIGSVPGSVPLYMRVKRAGSQWTQSYSYDGSNWITAVIFDHAMTVASVGAFFGNAGTNPAFTGSLDYFFNTASPIVPPDGGDKVPPVIDVWYGLNQKFGNIGVAQKLFGILGNVSDPAGISSLTYALNGGPQNAISLGPDGTRLQSKGDFNAEIEDVAFACGANTVVLTATDRLGNIGVATVDVEYTCGTIWPEAYTIDWSAVSDIQDAAQVVDGKWTLDGGSIRPAIQGYNRMVAFGDIDPSWDVYEVMAPVTINSLDSNAPYGPFVGFLFRWQGHQSWDNSQPKHGWYPIGALMGYDYVTWSGGSEYRLRIIGNKGASIAEDLSGKQLTVGETYIFKMRAETFGTVSVYSLKVWKQGTTEPAKWDIQGQGIQGELKYGSAALFSYYVDASFGDVTVTPGPFTDDVKVPVISNAQVVADAFSALVSWTTDEPATSRVIYGETTAYELGAVQPVGRPTLHKVLLTGLKPETLYHYKIMSADGNGNVVRTGDRTFTSTAVQSTIVSDDFSRCSLGSGVWSFVDPLDDASLQMTGTNVEIAVPSGVSHDAWITNNAPRIMQPANNPDFEIEVKFESAMNAKHQMQGVIVQQGSGNFLRFDVHSDGTNTKLYAAAINAGVGNVKYDEVIGGAPSASPFYMRIKREGTKWTQTYSTDGVSWTSGAVFTYGMTVNRVGAFAGNQGANPAHTAKIDYFFNTASPIVPEDSGEKMLAITVVGNGTVQKDPEKTNYLCGDVVKFTAVPGTNWSFGGWSGDISGSSNPATLAISGGNTVTATFVINTYALTVGTAGTGAGSVSGAGIYSHGDVAAVTAIPDVSSVFSGWSGDCSGSDLTTTVTMDGPKTCVANFVLKTFTILTAADNGSISCTPNPVDYGADATCIISRNAGYAIADVKVDGTSVGVEDMYLFENVTDDHEIVAEFFKTIGMVNVGDVNGSGKEDIAVFSVDPATGDNNVFVKDGFTGSLIRKITFIPACEIKELISVPDINSNGIKEVAVLCHNRTTGSVSVIIRDSLTGIKIKELLYNKAFSPLTAVVVPDVNGNLSLDVGVLGVNSSGSVQVQIKDTLSGAQIKNVLYDKAFSPLTAVVLDDMNSNGKPEIGVLGVNSLGNVRVQIKDASSGALIKYVPYNKAFLPLTAVVLDDMNSNGNPEIGVLGVNSLGNIQVQIKDAFSAAGIKTLLYSKTITPVDAVVVPDVNGGGIPEVGVLGVNTTGGVVLNVKDAATNSLIRSLSYPKAYKPVTAVVLASMNSNDKSEIAVVGEDLATGDVVITVKDALTGVVVKSITIP